jgi:hypothetical protein
MLNSNTVRAELVEALSLFFIIAKKEQPFDRLRANGMDLSNAPLR